MALFQGEASILPATVKQEDCLTLPGKATGPAQVLVRRFPAPVLNRLIPTG